MIELYTWENCTATSYGSNTTVCDWLTVVTFFFKLIIFPKLNSGSKNPNIKTARPAGSETEPDQNDAYKSVFSLISGKHPTVSLTT